MTFIFHSIGLWKINTMKEFYVYDFKIVALCLLREYNIISIILFCR